MSLPSFPANLPGLEFDSTKTPMWSTRVLTAASGREQRSGNWTYPRWKFGVSFAVLRDNVNSEFQTLVGFCNAVQGQALPFLYQDPSDYAYTGQGIGTGNGVTTAFPIVRAFGGFVEPVLAAPVIQNVYVNGVAQPASAWSASSYYGYGNDTINFNTAPASGALIAADFTLNYVCRFTQDDFEFSWMMNHLWELKKMEFLSIK